MMPNVKNEGVWRGRQQQEALVYSLHRYWSKETNTPIINMAHIS
jgi:hypothetical protein